MGAAMHHAVGASMIETPEPAAQELDLPVLANDPVNDEYMLLVLKAPRDLLERCRAGQFFHLLCPAIGGEKPYLRRPMSIYGFYPDRGELHFLYKVTGSGTRALFHLGAGDGLATDADFAAIGPLQPRDAAQRRGLAAAGGAQQGDELARRDSKIDVVDRDLVAEILVQAVERHHRFAVAHGCTASVWSGSSRR